MMWPCVIQLYGTISITNTLKYICIFEVFNREGRRSDFVVKIFRWLQEGGTKMYMLRGDFS